MAWLDVIISTLALTYYTLAWAFFATLNATLYILQLAAWPITGLWNTLLFVCAPVIYTVRFLLSPLIFVLNNLPRLEPLYIYFGTAALIGLTCALVLALTTGATFSLLGLYDNDKPSPPVYSRTASAQHSIKSKDESRPQTPLTPGAAESRELDALLAGFSSPESDNFLARQGYREPPNTKRKRSSASGLRGGSVASRFGTILEEDDDSL